MAYARATADFAGTAHTLLDAAHYGIRWVLLRLTGPPRPAHPAAGAGAEGGLEFGLGIVTGPAAGDPVDHGQVGFPTTSFDHSQARFCSWFGYGPQVASERRPAPASSRRLGKGWGLRGADS